jgi:uncharacterized protein
MSVDHIRYDLLTQQALRSVVKRVLTDAAKGGLQGEHHFYIAFQTTAPGVRLSAVLREQYPEEMTIVLQHQFWDLGVTEQAFEVKLSFNGVPERLLVPFDAIKGFFDPSVQFGLQFEIAPTETAEAAEPAPVTKPAPAAKKEPRRKTEGTGALAKPAPASAPPAAVPATPAAEKGGAEVVRLDRFRKK